MRHALAEARSLAYHRAVATRIASDPALLDLVRVRLQRRIDGGDGSEYSYRWHDLLNGPQSGLLAMMCADHEQARALRQASPFANLLAPRERWALWAKVRADFERDIA
jgi:hypothetical protein